MEEKIHVFELADLGKAPFKCIGLYSIPSPTLAEANPDAYNNALRDMPQGFRCGTCSYCGQPIMNNYLIKSSDGKTFSVGCECVMKTYDNGMINKVKAIKSKLAREAREKKRMEQRKAEEAEQRKRNGGLTDWEIQVKKNEEKRMEAIRIKETRIRLLSDLVERMRDGKGGFRDSVAAGMRDGDIPFGRGRDIACDILAKQCGRQNSKEYELEYDRVENIFCQVEKNPKVFS